MTRVPWQVCGVFLFLFLFFCSEVGQTEILPTVFGRVSVLGVQGFHVLLLNLQSKALRTK